MALGYVRPARGSDVPEIARIQHTTWQVAYSRFIPRFAIDDVRPEWLEERWTEAVTAPPSGRHRVLIAIEQTEDGPERVVGFAAVGPADESVLAPDEVAAPDEAATPDQIAAPDEAATPDQIATPNQVAVDEPLAAVTDLLVEPRWGRRGHGSRLLAAAVDHWRSDGFTRAVAWAFEQDAATVKFLGSAGWEPDGARRALDIEGVLVPQVRLHVGLGRPGAEGPDR